jgi:hypothetical protein
MNSLMEKLMISKKIMEKSDQISRGSVGSSGSNYDNGGGFSQNVQLQEFSSPIAKYNIPEEYASAQQPVQKIPQGNPLDRIQNSKLPDAIKKLMIEHPIAQVKPMEPTISDDVIEAASRLMKKDKEKSGVPNQQVSYSQGGLSANDIKKIVRETMEEVLSEQGLMVESETKASDTIQIKVGQHLFVGKISKIKKLQ